MVEMEEGTENEQSVWYVEALGFAVALRFNSVERMMDVYIIKGMYRIRGIQ